MTRFVDHRDEVFIRDAAARLRDWLVGLETPPKVAVVYGGVSAEDRLYLAECPPAQLSITALRSALDGVGLPCTVLDPCDPEFIPTLPDHDVVLSNLHGPYGEDGRLQGLLDYLRLPCCGSGVAASAITADKITCKRFMAGLDVPTPTWRSWSPGELPPVPPLPVMVKPSCGGSSVGMSLVRDLSDLGAALSLAWETDRSPVLVEDYVEGLPVTVGALELPGGVVLFPPLSTQAEADYYDAETKLGADGRSRVTVGPAELAEGTFTELEAHVRTLWDGLGLRGGARVDFVVDQVGRPQVLEVNTTPGLSWDSNFVIGAQQCALELHDIVRACIHEALTRPPYDGPLPEPALAVRAPKTTGL